MDKIQILYDHLQENLKNAKSCPSLEKMSLLTLAISFWQKDAIKLKIINYFGKKKTHKSREWHQIEAEAIKGLNLRVPPNLKDELKYTVAMVGVQIHEWIKFLERFTFNRDVTSKAFVNDIVWTVHGAINKKETFILLYNDDNNEALRTNGSLYNLACHFCLVNYMKILWNELPVAVKQIYDINRVVLGAETWNKVEFARSIRELINCDLCIAYDFVEPEMGIEFDLVLQFIWDANDANDARNKLIGFGWDEVGLNQSDTVYFLINHSSVEQLEFTFRHSNWDLNFPNMLQSLLNSNRFWHDFLYSTVTDVIDFFNVSCEIYLCILLGDIPRSGLAGFLKKRVFKSLWSRFSIELKQRVLSDRNHRVMDLLNYEDFDLLKIMLNSVDEKRKFKLMMSKRSTCVLMVVNDGGAALDLFLREIFKNDCILRSFKRKLCAFGIDYVGRLTDNGYEYDSGNVKHPSEENIFKTDLSCVETLEYKLIAFCNHLPAEENLSMC